MKITIILFLSVCFFVRCNSNYKEHIIGNYYLCSNNELKEDLELVYLDMNHYRIMIIPARIFAIGNDSNYIIAKRKPSYFAEKTNNYSASYYIINLNDSNIKANPTAKIQPLSKQEFLQLRDSLKIPDSLKFRHVP